MKKQMILLTLVATNLLLVSSVAAVENTNNYRNIKENVKSAYGTPNVTPVKQMMQENRQVIKDERGVMKTTVSAEKEVLSETVLTNMINMLNIRLQNAIDRLTKRAELLDTVAVRIDERLTQVETEKGVTLTEARSLLTQAKTELANSKVLIASIKINTVTTKTELDTERQSLKTQVDKAYQSLKKVSELLRQSVNKAIAKSVSTTPRPKSTFGVKPSMSVTPTARRGIPVPTVNNTVDQ